MQLYLVYAEFVNESVLSIKIPKQIMQKYMLYLYRYIFIHTYTAYIYVDIYVY